MFSGIPRYGALPNSRSLDFALKQGLRLALGVVSATLQGTSSGQPLGGIRTLLPNHPSQIVVILNQSNAIIIENEALSILLDDRTWMA